MTLNKPQLHLLSSKDGRMNTFDYSENVCELYLLLENFPYELAYSFTYPPGYTPEADVRAWHDKCVRMINKHNKKIGKHPEIKAGRTTIQNTKHLMEEDLQRYPAPTIKAEYFDENKKRIYTSEYPEEPMAEWFVTGTRGPYTIKYTGISEEVGEDDKIHNWIRQCESTLQRLNQHLTEETYPAPAPGKAKSDKLGLGLVLIPLYSIFRIGSVFIEGLRYGRDNWKKGVFDKEYQEERLEHALRHLFLWKEGDRNEDHLAKVAWFCVTQMEIERLEDKAPCSPTPKTPDE
jgi:hypothetical protein